jgi:hypothetical protein
MTIEEVKAELEWRYIRRLLDTLLLNQPGYRFCDWSPVSPRDSEGYKPGTTKFILVSSIPQG